MNNIRIGHGYDVHAFSNSNTNKKNFKFITLGGVKIPHNKQLIAHSDGDVLIHSVCDAILGALGFGDIGKHFPDTNNDYKNIDSRELLKKVIEIMQKQRYKIGNIDTTIIAQKPKVSDYTQEMQQIIAGDCNTQLSNVNIKATTTEKLGFIGKGKGIAVHCVCLLYIT